MLLFVSLYLERKISSTFSTTYLIQNYSLRSDFNFNFSKCGKCLFTSWSAYPGDPHFINAELPTRVDPVKYLGIIINKA